MARKKSSGSEIVYSSNVLIDDESELATLAVFYDRVALPHASKKTNLDCWLALAGERLGISWDAILRKWEVRWEPLFQEDVLRRLPEAQEDAINKSSGDQIFDPLINDYFLQKVKLNTLQQMRIAFEADLKEHHSRIDIDAPRIYSLDGVTGDLIDRTLLVQLEASSVFNYLLPRLSGLQPDDILELRNKVKDAREGFAMHLQNLSKGLDGLVKADAKLEELKGYAQNIVETELIPDYREFRRQLESERAGKWTNALDATGKIMEIDAAPWTPKFWGMLLKALGMSVIKTAADQKDRLSNRYQAHEFMKGVEDTGQRIRAK